MTNLDSLKCLTVRELIEFLQTQNPELPVVIPIDDSVHDLVHIEVDDESISLCAAEDPRE